MAQFVRRRHMESLFWLSPSLQTKPATITHKLSKEQEFGMLAVEKLPRMICSASRLLVGPYLIANFVRVFFFFRFKSQAFLPPQSEANPLSAILYKQSAVLYQTSRLSLRSRIADRDLYACHGSPSSPPQNMDRQLPSFRLDRFPGAVPTPPKFRKSCPRFEFRLQTFGFLP